MSLNIGGPVVRDRGVGDTTTLRRLALSSKPFEQSWFRQLIEKLFGMSDQRLALERHVTTIHTGDGADGDSHRQRIESFAALQKAIKPAFHDSLVLDISPVPTEGFAGDLTYSIRIDDVVLYAGMLPATDRAATLGFYQALVRTGQPTPAPTPVGWQDALMMARLAAASIDPRQVAAAPDVAHAEKLRDLVGTIAARLDALAPAIDALNVGGHPISVLGQKVRLLAEAVPEIEFSMDFDPAVFGCTVRAGGKVGDEYTVVHRTSIAATPDADLPPLFEASTRLTLNNHLQLAASHGAIDLAGHIETNAQCMSDDADVQALLLRERNNPKFSSETFRGITVDPGGGTFTARFADGMLTLSDRAPSKHELRGVLLRDALRGQYANLGEIMARGHMSASDSRLLYTVSPAHSLLLSAISDMSADVMLDVYERLADVPVGGTTIGEAWKIDERMAQLGLSAQWQARRDAAAQQRANAAAIGVTQPARVAISADEQLLLSDRMA